VAKATITFSPVQRHDKDKEPGKPATAFSDDNGIYELSTFRNYDGALVGKHRVKITLEDNNPAKCPRSKELILEVGPSSNELDIELNK
jgi:hypothetical protein